MVRFIFFHICLWMKYGAVHASLENYQRSEEYAAEIPLASHSESTCSCVQPDAHVSTHTRGYTVAANAATGCQITSAKSLYERHRKLYEQFKRDVHAAHPVAESVDRDSIEYLFVIPVLEIPTYLHNRMSRPSEQPLSSHLDCPSKDDIVWGIDTPLIGISVYHDVAKNLKATYALERGVLTAQAKQLVTKQTKYVNYLRSCRKTTVVSLNVNNEMQWLAETIRTGLCHQIYGKQLRVHFGAQLLVAGLYSYITEEMAKALYTLDGKDTALLTCYMLQPEHADRFPSFVSALYFFLCKGNLTPENLNKAAASVFASWNYAAAILPHALRVATYQSAVGVVKTCIRGAEVAGVAAEAAPQSQLCSAPQRSIYWHAVVAAVAFITDSDKRSASSSTLSEMATTIMELIPCSVSCTVPWGYWEPLLIALAYVVPRKEFCAFVIARTPPALAAKVALSTAISAQARQIIATFWLALETPHTRGVLEILPTMLKVNSYAYICSLLKKLPIETLVQMSSESVDKILLLLAPHIRDSICTQWAGPADSSNNQIHLRNDGRSGKRGNGGCEDEIPQAPSSRAHNIVGHSIPAAGVENTARKRSCNENTPSSISVNKIAPVALCRLLLLRRSASDVPNTIIDHLFSDTAILHNLLFTINSMATERPVRSNLCLISQLHAPALQTCRQLLSIFGNKRIADEAAQPRKALKCGPAKSQTDVPYDIPRQVYENGRTHFQAIAPFFYRQIFPRLVQLVCKNPHLYNYAHYISAISHLLGVSWFQEQMVALEGALEQIGTELAEREFHVQRWMMDFQHSTRDDTVLLNTATAAVATHCLVHKERPDVALPLPLVEQRMQVLCPGSPLTVRAYITIATLLDQLAVSVLSNTHQTLKALTRPESMQLLLERLVRFNLYEQPFVLMPAAEASGSEAIMNAALRAQLPPALWHVPHPKTVFRRAMCTTCYYYLVLLNYYQNSDASVHFGSICWWMDVFLWLFNHPLARHLESVAVARAWEMYKIDLASAKLRVVNIQTEIINALEKNMHSVRIDMTPLEQYLKDMCVALEHKIATKRRNVHLTVVFDATRYKSAFAPARR